MEAAITILILAVCGYGGWRLVRYLKARHADNDDDGSSGTGGGGRGGGRNPDKV